MGAPNSKPPIGSPSDAPGVPPKSHLRSSSFLLEPEPTLAHFHTPSPVARSLTKLNFNYFFLIKKTVKTAVFNWQQLLGQFQQGRVYVGGLVWSSRRQRKVASPRWHLCVGGHRSWFLAGCLTGRCRVACSAPSQKGNLWGCPPVVKSWGGGPC